MEEKSKHSGGNELKVVCVKVARADIMRMEKVEKVGWEWISKRY